MGQWVEGGGGLGRTPCRKPTSLLSMSGACSIWRAVKLPKHSGLIMTLLLRHVMH